MKNKCKHIYRKVILSAFYAMLRSTCDYDECNSEDYNRLKKLRSILAGDSSFSIITEWFIVHNIIFILNSVSFCILSHTVVIWSLKPMFSTKAFHSEINSGDSNIFNPIRPSLSNDLSLMPISAIATILGNTEGHMSLVENYSQFHGKTYNFVALLKQSSLTLTKLDLEYRWYFALYRPLAQDNLQ